MMSYKDHSNPIRGPVDDDLRSLVFKLARSLEKVADISCHLKLTLVKPNGRPKRR